MELFRKRANKIKLPLQLKTASGKQTVYKCKWEDIIFGEIVYLFARCSGLPYALGPFTVIDAQKRLLRRLDIGSRNFTHMAEELYRKELKGN